MDADLYYKESEKLASKYALLKDEILNETAWDLFEKYGFNEQDAAVLSLCISIKATKDTVKRLRGGR